ncbi:CoA-disulfide reductase [Vagococcus humatus]|uniref:CoA-disulfide reductase n=1 Tax=Vagococcus humatus TaxID=1889241 RepID=A0A3S0AW79_9ENTE|nr:CoA-disulfide reductase [Vagococcus humatus]RST88557.1 CoA-disulfide reductase [Vagococcus humatus]
MKIIIIGGTAAGMSAAAKVKRLQPEYDVLVFEKTPVVSLGACGLPYYVGDFFNDTERLIARTPEAFRKTGVELFTEHEVTDVDIEKRVVTVLDLTTGQTHQETYDQLMVASGASPILPPIKNLDLKGVHTLKTLQDGQDIKQLATNEQVKEVVIVGAGFIGLELAEAMHRLGKHVRIIQLDSRVIPDAFDTEVTAIMEEELINQGIQLNLDEFVTELQGRDTVQQVITNKGVYPADLIIIATGVKPNTQFLPLDSFDTLGNGALVIDEFGKTSQPNIYSAGDCASVYHRVRKENVFIPLATTANKLGRLVGENLAGKELTFQGTLGSSAVQVMSLEAGRTGITEKEAIDLGVPYKTVWIHDKNQTDYYPGQSPIHVKLVYHAETKVLLGGQIIGAKGAVLRVDVLATAIQKEMTTDELGMLDLCYAPPFARTWDVLNVAGNVAK